MDTDRENHLMVFATPYLSVSLERNPKQTHVADESGRTVIFHLLKTRKFDESRRHSPGPR